MLFNFFYRFLIVRGAAESIFRQAPAVSEGYTMSKK